MRRNFSEETTKSSLCESAECSVCMWFLAIRTISAGWHHFRNWCDGRVIDELRFPRSHFRTASHKRASHHIAALSDVRVTSSAGWNHIGILSDVERRARVIPFRECAAIRTWPTPKNLTELRGFLGLASFYRRHCKSFSQIAVPLTDMLKKDRTFDWTADSTAAFEQVKDALSSAPLLIVPDPDKDYETDADY